MEFIRDYCRVAIVIVGKSAKVATGPAPVNSVIVASGGRVFQWVMPQLLFVVVIV